ncbi:MAG: S8 family peptidase [Desulfurococcales archaeon]|nr:S8 family peptidase [Desulfurococcales archaeon]
MGASRYVIPVLIVALFILPVTAGATVVPQKSFFGGPQVTFIVSIDKAKFSPAAVEKLGGTVVYVADLVPVAIVRAPLTAVNALAGVPGVVHVSPDGVVKAHRVKIEVGPPKKGGSQVLPWGVDYIDAEKAWSITNGFVDVNGDGDSEIEVAIIDTGVDADHEDLYMNIKWGIAVQNGRISGNFDDKNGHGTHVSGTVAAMDNDIGVVGVAPKVEVYMIKALGNGGSGSWSDLVIALDLAVKGPDGVIDSDGDGVVVGDPDDDAPEVISMSLGGSSAPEEVHDAIIAAYNLGITIVAAAGNEGDPSPSYPAAYPEVIAVGAIDSNGDVPSWSNRQPEVAAPGVDILSTYLRDGYETLSGTSMATPHVSATVALIQAARLAEGLPLLPPGTPSDMGTDTVRGILHSTATDAGSPGYDELYGYGIINAYQAVLAATG